MVTLAQPALLRSQPNTAGDITSNEEVAYARPVNDRRALTGSALPASPSSARTSPSIRTRAVSDAGRATGAWSVRGRPTHDSGPTTTTT